MSKIKSFFQNNWVIIAFTITTAIDVSTGFLESLELGSKTIGVIRFLGAILLAYKTNANLKSNAASKLAVVASDNSDPVRTEHPKTRH
jgi:hypothetical protein